MNLLTLAQIEDLSAKRVFIPLSGGINSAAVLCFLIKHYPPEYLPENLFMFYAHLKEHSPDTFPFVADLVRLARRHFKNVTFRMNRNSVNKFFREQKFIPHPTVSPCTRELKLKPMYEFADEIQADVQFIGFVKHEIRRYKRQQKKNQSQLVNAYPLLEMTDADCFQIVKNVLGWYPAIYDLEENGKRVFKHNNCLPCKNGNVKDFQKIAKYFPAYAKEAELTADLTGGFWGREDVPNVFKCDVCERI